MKSKSISIDTIFDVISYIDRNSVTEMLFIQDAYLGVIYDDDEFIEIANVLVCSFDLLFKKFQDA